MKVKTREKTAKSDLAWRQQLTPLQYEVTRRKATERPFSGVFNGNKAKGVYRCICCDEPLFSSVAQFESGSGWPSFLRPVPDSVEELPDKSFGMIRTEVTCSRCEAHLGHLFHDGPPPAGLRYCINSAALMFEAL